MIATALRAGLLATMLVAGGNVCAASPTSLDIQTADGLRHSLVVTSGDGPKPTVLVLHGALGTAAMTLRTSGFAEAAAARGFNAVFLDGIDRQWNDGRTGGRVDGHGGPDDIAFIRALVDRLIADRVAQPDRVYIAGISNGGMMSLTMACKAGPLFAGLGTVIANMPAGIEPCALKPMPVVLINGTADPMVPYNGGNVGLRKERGTVLGVDQTTALFAKADGCGSPTSKPIPKNDVSGRTSVVKITWNGCKPDTSLTLYRVDGGGHGVPGRTVRGVNFLGPVNLDFVAADVIMEAFAALR